MTFNKQKQSSYQNKKAKNIWAVFYFNILKKIKIKNDQIKYSWKNYKHTNYDQRMVASLSKNKIPNFRQLKYVKSFVGKKEYLILKISFLIIITSAITWGIIFYKNHLELLPIAGGEYIEGLIGAPKYVNPLYSSTSDVDNDLSKLIFSSLFQRNKENRLIKDLVVDYEIDESKRIYTVRLRSDAKWHNTDKKLTSDDLIFTFNAIKNKEYNSPLRTSFVGVTIEKVNQYIVKFHLTEPYAAFLDLLTFGILPAYAWGEILPEAAYLAELNIKPIGSGMYELESLTKDKAGNIQSYNLIINENYYGVKSYVSKLSFSFFVNFEEAIVDMNSNNINGISYLPSVLKENIVAQDSLNFHSLNIPHITAIFLNQKNNVNLKNIKIREALALAINKQDITNNTVSEEVYVIHSPILPNNFAYKKGVKKNNYNPQQAKKNLLDDGWKEMIINEEEVELAFASTSTDEKIMKKFQITKDLGEGTWLKKKDEYLIINLTTVDNENNIKVVNSIKQFWEAIGIKTNIEIISTNEIQITTIKPRNFEALFYGQVVGTDPDLYAFWHSSQVGENGLNITNYINKKVDGLLEDARLTTDREKRVQYYYEFQDILAKEIPAIFMYSPTYTYVQDKKIKGFDVKNILLPSDRFVNISEWYIKTSKKLVW